MVTTIDLLYSEIQRLAIINYADPITQQHCISCGRFLLDTILSKLRENNFFIEDGSYSRQAAWARKYAHIRSIEFKKFDVFKRDPISKKTKRTMNGKTFVDLFIKAGIIYRNDKYSNFSKKTFSKSYMIGEKYYNALISEYESTDLKKNEVKELIDMYYDTLACFWYSSFHDFWKYSLGHALTKEEQALFNLTKERMPKTTCSYEMKLADIWGFDIPKSEKTQPIECLDDYPF